MFADALAPPARDQGQGLRRNDCLKPLLRSRWWMLLKRLKGQALKRRLVRAPQTSYPRQTALLRGAATALSIARSAFKPVRDPMPFRRIRWRFHHDQFRALVIATMKLRIQGAGIRLGIMRHHRHVLAAHTGR